MDSKKSQAKLRSFLRNIERTLNAEMKSRLSTQMKVGLPISDHISQTFHFD